MPQIPSTDCRYEELSHTSEIGLRLEAETAVGLFICAAQAMFHFVHPDFDPFNDAASPPETEPTGWQQIAISADDTESLLVDWLSELLYLYETTGSVFHRYNINIWEPTFIEATVSGEKPDEAPAMHIKAVTYHQIDVTQTTDSWQARVFFDI